MIPQSEISTLCKNEMTKDISMKKRSSNLTHIRAEVEHYTSDLPKSATFGTRIQALGNDLGMTPRQYLCKMETDRREARRIKKGDVREGACVECAICGYKAKTLVNHVRNMHGLSPDEYKAMYGVKRVSTEDTGFAAGSENPAFGHGGKFSPWSEKFIHGYDGARHDEFKKAQSNFQKTNESNVFRREFYATGEEYYKSQTRDLKWFIERYGRTDGKRRHALKTERWLNTMNSKSDDELNDINSRKVRKSSCFYSAAEKEILSCIRDVITEVGFAKSLLSPFTGRRYVYDIHSDKRIIEYDGDFWHANPATTKDDFVCPYRGMTVHEIRARDDDKNKTAIHHGFQIMRVWEKDYKKDKQGTIEKCIQFLRQ